MDFRPDIALLRAESGHDRDEYDRVSVNIRDSRQENQLGIICHFKTCANKMLVSFCLPWCTQLWGCSSSVFHIDIAMQNHSFGAEQLNRHLNIWILRTFDKTPCRGWSRPCGASNPWTLRSKSNVNEDLATMVLLLLLLLPVQTKTVPCHCALWSSSSKECCVIKLKSFDS